LLKAGRILLITWPIEQIALNNRDVGPEMPRSSQPPGEPRGLIGMERRRTKMHQSSLRHLRSRMPLSGSGALLVSLCMILWAIGSFSGFAQKTSRTLEDLEREFTDPLTTLPQLF
jgi:hypothetical protein